MIPDGAPSFIVLAICAAMMAVVIALMNMLYNMHLLGRPLYQRWPGFTFFSYTVIVFAGYLVAQILGISRIMLQAPPTEQFISSTIMVLLFVQNASIITGLVWVYQYRHEPPSLPPKE